MRCVKLDTEVRKTEVDYDFGDDDYDEEIEPVVCEVKEVASNRLKKCRFPFVYKGHVFDKCTVLDSGPSGTPWCSTKTLSTTNQHINKRGFWGDCPSQCKFDPLKRLTQRG